MSLDKQTTLDILRESRKSIESKIYNETVIFSRNIARLEKERNKIAKVIENIEENL